MAITRLEIVLRDEPNVAGAWFGSISWSELELALRQINKTIEGEHVTRFKITDEGINFHLNGIVKKG
jgi:hypothetical protein